MSFDFRNLSMDQILNFTSSDFLTRAFQEIERGKKDIYILVQNECSPLQRMKIETTLTLAILGKMKQGKNPKTFTQEDWKNIADTVSEYGIEIDDREYSEFVFLMYAKYIDDSADGLEKLRKEQLTEDKLGAIRALSDHLRKLSKKLELEEIKETDYIEDCLWISLEAMMKLLAAFLTISKKEEVDRLKDAVAVFAYEYARYAVYSREKAVVDELIEHQMQLDIRLQAEYEQFLKELAGETAQFQEMIAQAFSADFEKRFKGSAEMALEAGVSREEILCSEEDIDDFFLA